MLPDNFSNGLFGSCGVRGVVGEEITEPLVVRLAAAFAEHLGDGKRVCIGRDTRRSGPELEAILSGELRRCGIHVTRLGVISTPGLYFLTRELGFDSGVMITASHNPPNYNGFKLCDPRGMCANQESIEACFYDSAGCRAGAMGDEEFLPGADILYEHLARICPAPREPLRLVLDCACGPSSTHLPAFLRRQGHDVLEVNCVSDVEQCDRVVEPMPSTLGKTIEFLPASKADAGICLDGDNDRVVFLDREGFLGFQRANAIVATVALEQAGGSGEIVGSAESGRYVEDAVTHAGGTFFRTVVGDIHIAQAVHDRGAVAGVEECGHFILPGFGFFSSTVFTSTFLLANRDINTVREELSFIPPIYSSENRIDCAEDAKRAVMDRIRERMSALDGRISTLDGVRVDWEDGWLLVRPSGTSPYMKVNAEAFNESRLEQLVSMGKEFVREAMS